MKQVIFAGLLLVSGIALLAGAGYAPFLPSNPAGHAQCMNDCFMFGPIQCPTIPGPDGQPMCKVPGKPCTNKDGLPSSCTRVGSPDGNCWCP
jgi:hypothetical protein